ncbi:hypothetical protein VOLCADRAFT_95198 [Volvox carteri f. nagariensis]|uniref:Uncharacterized protein n=1 Tax=Volvox carteri f. nagariensis TaxID=3068 RepID=D8U6V7_VOLCA|nr:uncharacterized protein VOLCADRAFT_95198 [Volvox carteri f. nagariensis]EFJ44579.1 hypothetical protein VOLCADRAFT_95198 [Volvox carteri f. nagariensis]|eukprot:XP_002954429.1 hypothetical protein VOLCADRAFT_95198 [Volvox carteri f. nagariensis]
MLQLSNHSAIMSRLQAGLELIAEPSSSSGQGWLMPDTEINNIEARAVPPVLFVLNPAIGRCDISVLDLSTWSPSHLCPASWALQDSSNRVAHSSADGADDNSPASAAVAAAACDSGAAAAAAAAASEHCASAAEEPIAAATAAVHDTTTDGCDDGVADGTAKFPTSSSSLPLRRCLAEVPAAASSPSTSTALPPLPPPPLPPPLPPEYPRPIQLNATTLSPARPTACPTVNNISVERFAVGLGVSVGVDRRLICCPVQQPPLMMNSQGGGGSGGGGGFEGMIRPAKTVRWLDHVALQAVAEAQSVASSLYGMVSETPDRPVMITAAGLAEAAAAEGQKVPDRGVAMSFAKDRRTVRSDPSIFVIQPPYAAAAAARDGDDDPALELSRSVPLDWLSGGCYGKYGMNGAGGDDEDGEDGDGVLEGIHVGVGVDVEDSGGAISVLDSYTEFDGDPGGGAGCGHTQPRQHQFDQTQQAAVATAVAAMGLQRVARSSTPNAMVRCTGGITHGDGDGDGEPGSACGASGSIISTLQTHSGTTATFGFGGCSGLLNSSGVDVSSPSTAAAAAAAGIAPPGAATGLVNAGGGGGGGGISSWSISQPVASPDHLGREVVHSPAAAAAPCRLRGCFGGRRRRLCRHDGGGAAAVAAAPTAAGLDMWWRRLPKALTPRSSLSFLSSCVRSPPAEAL